MKHSLGAYSKAYRKSIKKLKKNKYWRLGYKAAGKNKNRNENPYNIPTKYWDILKKRTYWDMGWEEKAYTPSRSKLKKMEERVSKHKKHRKH